MDISAYIHIPFCIRKCLYCDFASFAGKEDLFAPYVEALKAEIGLYAAQYPDAHVPTVYFGGGTPNLFSPDQLASILDQLRASFDVAPDAEITMEANPGAGEREKGGGEEWGNGGKGERKNTPGSLSSFPPFFHSVSLLRRSGVTRLSLGIQSLHDNELRRLGRVHTANEAVQGFVDARAAGFDNVSVDLMYGIPEQTFESWQQTLAGILDLGPEHVSLYSLTLEEGTTFWDMCQSGSLELPGSEIEADMYEEAIRVLTGAGFVHYEISNFARPGFESRHNTRYWDNLPYFGFGSGATSYLPPRTVQEHLASPRPQGEGVTWFQAISRQPSAVPDPQHPTPNTEHLTPSTQHPPPPCSPCLRGSIFGTRSTNVRAVEEYIRRIGCGESAVESSECLTGRAAMGETMFLGLRLLRGVSIEAFASRYGVAPDEVFGGEIEALVGRGLLEEKDGYVRLTKRGLFLANEVFVEFVQ